MKKLLQLQPITKAEADEFIRTHHRHHKPSVGWKFGVAVNDGEKIVGVAILGRPVARAFDDGWTLEVTRLCTDGTKNVASKLYSAAMRAARALGYRRIITYTLETESGTSLKAAGWREVWKTRGASWSCQSRPRVDKHPLLPKILWARELERRLLELAGKEGNPAADREQANKLDKNTSQSTGVGDIVGNAKKAVEG